MKIHPLPQALAICALLLPAFPLRAQDSSKVESAPPAATQTPPPDLVPHTPPTPIPRPLGAAESSTPASFGATSAAGTPAVPPLPASENEALTRFEIDPVHSAVGFRVKHLFSFVPGRFRDFSGTLFIDPKAPEKSRVQVTIQTASIDTADEKRDTHLRGPDFFDAKQFPQMTFNSKKVNISGEETAFITGDLTIRGVQREVILQTKFLGKGKGNDGRMHTGWEARTSVKRSDFGLTWSKTVEGTQLVGDNIEITLEIDAIEPKQIAPAIPNTPPTPESGAPAPAAASGNPAAPDAAHGQQSSMQTAPPAGESKSATPAGSTAPSNTSAPALPGPSTPATPSDQPGASTSKAAGAPALNLVPLNDPAQPTEPAVTKP
ncbi:MAG TPA: YceI family protein [Chthoniobacteraceae bacterium]